MNNKDYEEIDFDDLIENSVIVDDFGRFVFVSEDRLRDFIFEVQMMTRKQILESL